MAGPDPLLELLKRHAYQAGAVTLASGKVSDFYIDCRKVTMRAGGAVAIGARGLRAIEAYEAETGAEVAAIGGLALGAVPVACAVAHAAGRQGRDLDAFAVRATAKAHGAGQRIEGLGHVAPGTEIVVCEDVVTSGGSALKAVEALRAQGHWVRFVLALVDREEGGRAALAEAGLRLEAMYCRRDFVG